MGSTEQADRARALYGALAAGDAATVHTLLSPAFEGRTAAGLPLGLGGRYVGPESMTRDFWWRLGRTFSARADPEHFAGLDDGRLQVTGTYRGSARATGRVLEAAFVHVIGFDAEGRIASLDQLTDTAAWHDALVGRPVAFPPYPGPTVDALETIEYEVCEHVAHIRLNRPDRMNAIDLRMAEESLAVARAVAADPTVRAVLVSGNGPWLSAGGDLTYFREWPAESYGALLERMTGPFHEALRILGEVPVPVVTAAHGATAGGALGFVYVADVVLAADDATFCPAFSGIGLSGDGGGTWHLPRLVGLARARRAYLENLRLDAKTALEWGLVAEVVPAAELPARALQLAGTLAAGPTVGFAHQRRLFRQTWTSTLAEQLRAETEAIGVTGSTSDAVVVMEELSAHGLPLLIWVISPAICGSILADHAGEAMKKEWLPGLADGTRKMAFGLTEPDAGSNSHEITTTARRDGDGWRISGQKYYISAIDQCDAVLLVTRDGDLSVDGSRKLSMFVVPTDSPGLTLQPIPTSIVSPDQQFTVFLDDVRVGPDALVGEAGHGLRQVFSGLNPERILVGAICGGVGRYAVRRASEYAVQRRVWSTPIGAHQGVAHPLAQSHIDVEVSRLATRHAAELADARHPGVAEACNIAKFAASEAALRALDQAIQVHGGNGLAQEYGLSELWFVTRLMRTAPVSREMVLNFVAQTSLGLPRSY